MNQKPFIFKTLHSPATTGRLPLTFMKNLPPAASNVPPLACPLPLSTTLMRSFFLNPLTPSSLNPFLLLLSLSLLSPFTACAWDDEEDFGTSSYGISSYGTSSYQKKPALDRDDDKPAQPRNPYAIAQPRSALKVETIPEANDRRNLEWKEFTANSERMAQEHRAEQRRFDAQQAKQQAVYDKMNQEECEMAEFLGGVYKAKFGATTGRNSGVTSEGYVYRSGDNFVTPRGIYTKNGNTYAGPDSFTTQTGTLFFGNKGTTIQAGGAYFSEGESGFIVGPNCRNTSTWRSR